MSKLTVAKILITKKDIVTAFDIFFDKYDAKTLEESSEGDVFEQFKAHADHLISASNQNPFSLALFERATLELPKEIYTRRDKAKTILSHSAILGHDITDKITNPQLIRLYLRAWQYNHSKRSSLHSIIYEQMINVGQKGISRDLIAVVSANFFEEKEALKLEALKRRIAYTGVDYDEAISRLKAFIAPALKPGPRPEEEALLTAKVLYHFMWQVKRKMHRLEVSYHMAPIFLSVAKGTGKSRFVEDFCRPFRGTRDDFYTLCSFDQLAKENKLHYLLSKYILNFDEMKGAKNADLQAFRTIITASHVSSRVYHSQSHDSLEVLSTAIGSANADNLGEIYKDYEGERRLFGIAIDGFKGKKADYRTLERLGHLSSDQMMDGFMYPESGFKSEAFWQLVDESMACQLPIDEVEEKQREDRPEDGIEEMFSKYVISAGEVPFSAKLLYRIYAIDTKATHAYGQILNRRQFTDHFTAYLCGQDGVKKEEIIGKSKSARYRDAICFFLAKNPGLEYEITAKFQTLHGNSATENPPA